MATKVFYEKCDGSSPTGIIYGVEAVDPGEGEVEQGDQSIKTNVVPETEGSEHPLLSGNGIIQMINNCIRTANAPETERTGEVKEEVLEGAIEASNKTKVPLAMLLFCCDWKEPITSRSSTSDASSIAQQIQSYVPTLKTSLERDPLNSEVFMAYVMNNPGEVKNRYDLAHDKDKAEKEAKDAGTDKDQIIMYKKRKEEDKETKVKRNNREFYDYFTKRLSVGRNAFRTNLGQEKTPTPLAKPVSINQPNVNQITKNTHVGTGLRLTRNFNIDHLSTMAFHPILGQYIPEFPALLRPDQPLGIFGSIPQNILQQVAKNLQAGANGILEHLLTEISSDLRVKMAFTNMVPRLQKTVDEKSHLYGLSFDISVNGFENNMYHIAKDMQKICKNASAIDLIYGSGTSSMHVNFEPKKIADSAIKKDLPIIRSVDRVLGVTEAGIQSYRGF